MKVFINRAPVPGPWGGGSKVLASIINALTTSGHIPVFDLAIQDIDIFFCFDPRSNEGFPGFELIKNVASSRKKPIIQRVGDLGTHGKPELKTLLNTTVVVADHVVFPSEWARGYQLDSLRLTGGTIKNSSVIRNAPLDIFFEHRSDRTKLSKPIKIVTHHWSINVLKGFETYGLFNDFVRSNPKLVDFTYIGRVHNGYKTRIDNIIDPLDVDALSKILPMFDLYLTASSFEAGANHVLEAIAAGLPVLFSDKGGSICEYCDGVGLKYHNFDELCGIIETMTDQRYMMLKQDVLSRDLGSHSMLGKRYVELFDDMHAQYKHR